MIIIREMILQSHGEEPQYLQSNNALYDPLSYTLQFPYGDLGWSYNLAQNAKKIKEMKYYSNRFHFQNSKASGLKRKKVGCVGRPKTRTN